MKCPNCKAEMEYERTKFPDVIWICECGKEYEGEMFPCGADDYEERIENEVKREE